MTTRRSIKRDNLRSISIAITAELQTNALTLRHESFQAEPKHSSYLTEGSPSRCMFNIHPIVDSHADQIL